MDGHREAFELLDRYVERKMSWGSIPGVALGVTSRDGLIGAKTYGFSDLGARTAVRPETLFQIGSISKSFASIVAMQLVDEGKLDLRRPVVEYLPWLAVRSPHKPITMHHLLSHTAGLPTGGEATTETMSEVWSLRNLGAGPPGEFFHYSNMGYKIVGLVIEALTGVPSESEIARRVLGPLGMESSATTITQELRDRLAVGYQPAYDDRPMRRDAPMVPAPWIDSDSADGAISSTAEDMLRYLRLIMNEGIGPSGRIISESSYKTFVTPVIKAGPGAKGEWYAYGLDVETADGCTLLGHTGGMVGYISAMRMDMGSGVGVIVLSNGATSVDDVARYAVKLFRSSLSGSGELPREMPYELTLCRPEEYEGTYSMGDDSLHIRRAGDELFATHKGASSPLEPRDKDDFFLDLPGFEHYLLRFRREGDRIVEVTHGPCVYAPCGCDPPAEATASPSLAAHCGHYRCHNPWLTNFRVFERKGSLWLVGPSDEEHRLYEKGDGLFALDDPLECPEWVRFEASVGGRTHIAILTGEVYGRTFSP